MNPTSSIHLASGLWRSSKAGEQSCAEGWDVCTHDGAIAMEQRVFGGRTRHKLQGDEMGRVQQHPVQNEGGPPRGERRTRRWCKQHLRALATDRPRVPGLLLRPSPGKEDASLVNTQLQHSLHLEQQLHGVRGRAAALGALYPSFCPRERGKLEEQREQAASAPGPYPDPRHEADPQQDIRSHLPPILSTHLKPPTCCPPFSGGLFHPCCDGFCSGSCSQAQGLGTGNPLCLHISRPRACRIGP